MTCDHVRRHGGGKVCRAHVAEDDRRNNGIMVTHANEALELAVLVSKGLCAGMKLRLAECGHGSIADSGGGDTDCCRDGGGQECIEGIVTKLGEHEGGLTVVWTDMPVSERVERVEEGGRCSGRGETSRVEVSTLWDGREQGESESRCRTQGCHGRG